MGITINAKAVIFKTRQLLGLQDIHNGIKAAVWRLQLRSRVDNWGDKRAQSPPKTPRPATLCAFFKLQAASGREADSRDANRPVFSMVHCWNS